MFKVVTVRAFVSHYQQAFPLRQCLHAGTTSAQSEHVSTSESINAAVDSKFILAASHLTAEDQPQVSPTTLV